MGAGVILHGDLDAFVQECDRLGGLDDPRIADYFRDFEYRPTTHIDQQLDPFSEHYFQQQLQLYMELSGRQLNQSEGERTDLDVDSHVAGANPYRRSDIAFISKHARTIQTCLLMANLPHGARILDAGCGWGLSSEMMAFAGAQVTAIDINPLFVELVQKRASRLALPIVAHCVEFDRFETNEQFDLLFFYECLHHSVKPWETIRLLSRFVKPDGKILFAGEPVNNVWWKDWGLRLDPPSVYCIRKFGWWESGWSMEFIRRCFASAGFQLTAYPDVGLDNGPIGIATRTGAASCEVNESILEPTRRREREFAMRDAHLLGQIEALRQEIASLKSSRSWRITAPLRFLTRLLTGR